MKTIRRWILKYRASGIRTSILIAAERRDIAADAVAQLNDYIAEKQRKLRSLNAHIALLEHPRTLLDEALESRGTR